MDCEHPYDRVKKVQLNVVYKDTTLKQRTADICTDCRTVVSIEKTDELRLTIENTELDCQHPYDEVDGREIFVQNSQGNIYFSTEVPICTNCNHPAEEISVKPTINN